MFESLKKINVRPGPFEYYTADRLWTDEHTSRKMLELHLDENVDPASRRLSFIESSVNWLAARFRIGSGTRVCDFGCGPGLYATRLAEQGAKVTGVDFSPGSIHYARETAAANNLDIKIYSSELP